MPDPGIAAQGDLLALALTALGVLWGLVVLVRKLLLGVRRQAEVDAEDIDFTRFMNGHSDLSPSSPNRYPHRCPDCDVLLLEGLYGLECPRCHRIPPQ